MMLESNGHLGAREDTSAAIPVVVRRCADPRARLLDAVIATVACRGYDRTTVERIRQLADVPAAVFEEHFEHKEDCFVQALDAFIESVELRVVVQLGRDVGWPERVRSGLQALLGALAENADGTRAVLVECLSAGTVADKRYLALLRIFPALLEEGRFHSAYPDLLPERIAEALVGGILGILHRRALEDRTGELPRLLGDLAYFVLVPYLGHHRALVAAYAKKR
jgi:AcrR family transcriptional regulator